MFENQHTIIGMYLNDNWRAFRTWGVSAISPWEYHFFWSLRDGVDKSRKPLKTDWEGLQRPGFSPDYLGEQFERMDMAYERSDWIPTADGQAILAQQQAAFGLYRREAVGLHEQRPQFLSGRDGR